MAIILDQPMSEYLAMDALGSSTAFKAIMQSPMHARRAQFERGDTSAVADKGTIAHQILLEGHEENIVLIDAEDWRTKAAKEEREAARRAGKTPLLSKDINGIRTMVNMARWFADRSEIKGVFGTGNPEVTVTWEENGMPCKARPDYLSDDWHISLKTTNGIGEPKSWVRRQLTPMGYDFNLAFYNRGLKANGLEVQHRILVVEQNPPYGACLFALDPSKWAIADSLVDQAIKTWQKCLADGEFPGYQEGTYWAEASPWELAEAEERE